MNQILHVQLTINNVPKHKNIYIYLALLIIIKTPSYVISLEKLQTITRLNCLALNRNSVEIYIQKYIRKETNVTDCLFANEQFIVIAKIAENITKFRTPTYGKLRQIYLAQLMYNALCIRILIVSSHNYRHIC